MKRNWVRIAAFLLIVGVLCAYLAKVAATGGTDQDGHYSAGVTLAGLYAEPDDSLDVLILGTSTSGAAFLPKVIWDEQGIASYDFCTPVQSAATSYYLLQDALRSQQPKLVVLNASQLFLFRSSDDERVHSAAILLAMQQSQLKNELRRETMKHLTWESSVELSFPILLVHNYMPYVKAKDFTFENYSTPNNLKGAIPYVIRNNSPLTEQILAPSKEDVSFDFEGLAYVQKIVDLCKK